MTPAQLAKADRLRTTAHLDHVQFIDGQIEQLPLHFDSYDLVISSGVINLSATRRLYLPRQPACSRRVGDWPSPT
jgi:arsenite methyltransferase